jgi:hypothetical protein
MQHINIDSMVFIWLFHVTIYIRRPREALTWRERVDMGEVEYRMRTLDAPIPFILPSLS